MRIAAVIVTCNRIELLPRALKSIKEQSRQPDFVYIISNSTANNFHKEQNLCAAFSFSIFKNRRTENYAGALNTAVEQIIKENGISEDLYFASLDDDDEWLPNYLQEIENNNSDNYDLIAGNLLRSSNTENNLLVLPTELSEKDFLIGNPGISGSNTFIKLTSLLKSGTFDEGLSATIDRDFFVRVFLQKPKYKIVNKHLVTQYTDNDRERVTTNRTKKEDSLRIFFYKYQHLMNKEEKEQFFQRVEKLFSISKCSLEFTENKFSEPSKGELVFENKGNYQFVIGFITSDENYSERILSQIIEQNILVDLIVIINNSKDNLLIKSEQMLKGKIPFRIVQPTEWKNNLQTEQYGKAFSEFKEINSIPLGRTILHYHLHNETVDFLRPVYWIIDDDITFNFVKSSNDQTEKINLFEIVNQNLENVSAIIGSVSNDPPLPFLSSVRGQLVDLLHSHWANNETKKDLLNLRSKADYYYDLSDLLSNHLEIPIYHTSATDKAIEAIFSGKSISRKVIQKSEIRSIERVVTQRGPNTLVFNRELLHYYPVINVSVNHKFARRGDLLWVLFNQIISEHKIVEHTFSIQQNRTTSKFDLHRELEKSAYDIIGYAFNKGFLNTIQKIKIETNPNRPKDIFEKLETEVYFDFFLATYKQFLQGRKTKFLMNYYRVVGLLGILSNDFENAKKILEQVSNTNELDTFTSIMTSAESEETLKDFINELTTNIWTYSNAVTSVSESKDKHQLMIEDFFGLKTNITHLGSGSEGIAFTDNTFVYKSYFNMPIKDWIFLKEKSAYFSNSSLLEKIDCFEKGENKFIRYPFHSFKSLQSVDENELIQFLEFCKSNQLVFTNIAPKNFIQTLSGQLKLIDYGKSFEPFTEEKFINASKRAFLMYRFPTMNDEDFKKITSMINIGETPIEIEGWQMFYKKVLS
ncbi:MAG: glycosyltransferase family 2 protein [Flavobacteriales bacterium]|nr:glycosyltransferase family 2 protein [Flavobacteriales bacterium]